MRLVSVWDKKDGAYFSCKTVIKAISLKSLPDCVVSRKHKTYQNIFAFKIY